MIQGRRKQFSLDGQLINIHLYYKNAHDLLIFIFIGRDPAYLHFFPHTRMWTSVSVMSVYGTSFILTRRATIATV